MKHIKPEKFDELLTRGRFLVYFHATDCKPCLVQGPIFDALAEKHKGKGTHFIKVDIDKAEEVANRYRVRALPLTVLFELGVTKKRKVGEVPLIDLEQWVGFPESKSPGSEDAEIG